MVAQRRCWTNVRALTAHCAHRPALNAGRTAHSASKGQWQLLALEKQEKQIMQSQAPTC